ncbi:MAG: DUF6455 family protein [Pseudolabrys sp.]|jgi:hypothetical protein
MTNQALKIEQAEPAETDMTTVHTIPATSVAAWPTGVSLLAQMIDACQRCDETQACEEWLARAPGEVERAPDFCPNADGLAMVRKIKG